MAKNKSDVTQEVISVAGKFLGIRGITPEDLNKYMHVGINQSQQIASR